jgi:nucleoside-diphosphate-sugar epimerase
MWVREGAKRASRDGDQRVDDRLRDFYNGQSVLLTGATGFLGKPVIEKLLRSCPDIGHIYVLIRPRRDGSRGVVDAQTRFDREVITSGVFARLREEWGPGFDDRVAAKLTVVSGDLSREKLGLADDLYRELSAHVRIIINSAAVVVFDAPLDDALELNTLSPRTLMEFAGECARPVVVHVSTAYVNGSNPDTAPEAILPMDGSEPHGWRGPLLPADLDVEIADLKAVCDAVDAESRLPGNLAQYRKALKGDGKEDSSLEDARARWAREQLVQRGMERAKGRGWHDTYSFTKALGEQMVARQRGDIPTAIVRPSIIESSLFEPEPGWIDGYRMADPIIVAYGKGRLPDFPLGEKVVADLIPVDFVVNAVIASAERTARIGGLSVYHVATGTTNPLTYRAFTEHTRAHFQADPMLDKSGLPIDVPMFTFPTIKTFQRRMRWWRQAPVSQVSKLVKLLPAAQSVRRLRKRFASLENALERLHYYTVIYGPYIQYSYWFDTKQTRSLYRELSDEDKTDWRFDVADIDWAHYLRDVHIPGLKRNVLKMDVGQIRPPVADEQAMDDPDELDDQD